MKKYIVTLFILFLCYGSGTYAQNYPVLATPLLQPPYSLDLQDYQGPASKLKVQLLLRDLTKPSLEVYISIRLSGIGIELQTQPAVAALHTFTLQPGVPLTISGTELSPLFAQMTAQGLSYDDLLAGVSLPGGYYTWEVVAYLPDGRQVSNVGRAGMSVFKAQPPQITFPTHQAEIPATGINSVPFQWISRSATPAGILGTVYDMKIYELPDDITDPNVAVLSGLLPVFNIQTASTSYFYGSGDPQLIPGRRYAVVVQAQDLGGGDSYLNQGLSQVVAFKVAGQPDATAHNACPAPAGLSIRQDDPQTLEVSWNPVAEATDYLLQFRKANEPWQSQVTTDHGLMLIQLSPAQYQVQVASRCPAGLFSPISPIVSHHISTDSLDSEEEIIDPLTYYHEDEETPEPAEYEEPEEEEGLDILNTPFTLLIDTDALPDSLRANLTPDGSLPILPENPTLEQLKDAIKTKKTTCAAVIAGYTCGNHDAPGVPGGSPYSPVAGDELAINSIKIEVVEIDGAGNGLGIAHIKGFGNAKFGVELKGIKAYEGGCIYAGEAITNSVDLALLNQKQRAALAQAYATFNAALDKLEANAEGVAETINGLKEFMLKAKEFAKNYKGGKADGSKAQSYNKFAEKAKYELLKNKAIPDSLKAKLEAASLAAAPAWEYFKTGQPCTVSGNSGGGNSFFRHQLADCAEYSRLIEAEMQAMEAASLSLTCNCSPIVSECSPIRNILDQIRQANINKENKITISKVDGKSSLSNDTDWVSALNGIEIDGKCFKLDLQFHFSGNAVELSPNRYTETPNGFDIFNNQGNIELSLNILGETGQSKYFKQAILKKYLGFEDKKNIVLKIYLNEHRATLVVPKKMEKEFNKRYTDLNFDQTEFPIDIEYLNSDNVFIKLGTFNYIMVENKYLGQVNYGSTKLIDLIDMNQFVNHNDLSFNMNTSRPFANLKTASSFIGVILESNYDDFTFNGCSNSEGLSVGGSSSHKNGYNCDIRYLRKNNEFATSNLCGSDFVNIDSQRHIDLNTRLTNYGWNYLLSNHSKIQLYNTKHDKQNKHCDHLHLQSYQANFYISYE